MNDALGDVFLVYRCASCDELHEHHVGPLDADYVCAGLALPLAWVFERALGARECAALITLSLDDRPYALAVALGEQALGAIFAPIPPALAPHLTVPGGYAYVAREGVALPAVAADEEGMAALVEEAIRRARDERADLNRLLAGVEI